MVTSGNVSDITVAPVLLEDVEDTAVVGDKGYDSRELRDTLRRQDCEPCIPARSNVKNPEPLRRCAIPGKACRGKCVSALEGVPETGHAF